MSATGRRRICFTLPENQWTAVCNNSNVITGQAGRGLKATSDKVCQSPEYPSIGHRKGVASLPVNVVRTFQPPGSYWGPNPRHLLLIRCKVGGSSVSCPATHAAKVAPKSRKIVWFLRSCPLQRMCNNDPVRAARLAFTASSKFRGLRLYGELNRTRYQTSPTAGIPLREMPAPRLLLTRDACGGKVVQADAAAGNAGP